VINSRRVGEGNSACLVARKDFGHQTHMSKGYTKALAMAAPVAPATASPQGGIGASFDCPAILVYLRRGEGSRS